MPKPEHPPKASGAQAGFQNWRTLDTDFSIFREGWIGIKLNLKLWAELQETSRRLRASRILHTPPTDSLAGSVTTAPLLLSTRLTPAGGETADRAASPRLAGGAVATRQVQSGAGLYRAGPQPSRLFLGWLGGAARTSPRVVAAPRPMSAQGAVMEPGAAGSAQDPPPVWPRALGAGQGAAKSWVPRAGNGGAAGSHWSQELRPTLQPPPRLEVWWLIWKVESGLQHHDRFCSLLPSPPRGPSPTNTRSPACPGHVSRRP